MAAKEKSKIVKAELQDLSSELQELAINKEGCFYEYRPKNFAGSKIYNELYKKYKQNDRKFVFSDDLPESGILSICQGLASIISVIENLGSSAKNQTELLDELIDNLIGCVEYPTGGYVIDASPYTIDTNIFDKHVYIDGATWIISAILGIVRLNITGKYELSTERRDKLVDIYKYCLSKINASFIDSCKTDRAFNSGWNFTDGCEEPSIYFTFAVSEILIDMLTTFENFIRSCDVELIHNGIREELDKNGLLSSERYIRNKDRIEEALQNALSDSSFDGTGDALDAFFDFSVEEKLLISEIYQKSRFIEEQCRENLEKLEKNGIEVQREVMFFKLLNDGKKPYDEGSPYKKLEDSCKKSAGRIWELTADNLAVAFYSSDFGSTVAESTIESSVSSDAVFNVIFAINTIINAGLDEDAEDTINYYTINGSDEYNAAIASYDNMRDTLRLAYENCYQFFTHLKKNNKEYKINEYTLNFDESFSTHAGAVRDLRKARIRVFSLMPLMVRTKTTIGEFLIQYPQYDMILFLEQILKYRCWDKSAEKYLWIWENDAYSASSNYYFISALASFYDYYEKYENAFLENANNNRAAKKDIEEKYHKSLIEQGKAADKDISEFKAQEAEIRKLTEQVEELSAQIKGYRDDPLRSALSGFISGVIKETIIDILAEQLSNEAQRIISTTKDRVVSRAQEYSEENGGEKPELESWEEAPRSDKTNLEKGMGDILMALLAEHLGEAIYSVKHTADEREEGLDQIGKYVNYSSKDIRQAARYYLRGIADKRRSDFVANRGESTLSGGDHRFLMQLIEEKQKNKGDLN